MFQQFGLINYFQEKIVLHSNRCLLKKKRVGSQTPIMTLDHVSSAFSILLFGYVASFVIYIVEKVVKRVQSKKWWTKTVEYQSVVWLV